MNGPHSVVATTLLLGACHAIGPAFSVTLSTRHRQDDNRLLLSFVHEQLHWTLLARQRQALAAITELQAVFPEVPVGYPDGAIGRSSTYVHRPSWVAGISR